MASSSLKFEADISKDIDDNYDYSLLVTGVTGSGKSTFCNFLCCSNTVFEAVGGFASVTKKSAAATITMQDIRLKLIDTPGFCDDYDTEEEHMREFGEALVLASEGVNAIGLVISAKGRYTVNETNTIKYMTEFPELWPYMFLIFTNASSIGSNNAMQAKQLEENLKSERCPLALKDLVKRVNNRYIIVESVKPSPDPEAYYIQKTKELYTMITTLDESNDSQLYTNALFRKAKEMIDKLIKERDQVNEEIQYHIEDAKVKVQMRIDGEKEAEDARQKMEAAKIERDKLPGKIKLLEEKLQKDITMKEREKEELRQQCDKLSKEKRIIERRLKRELVIKNRKGEVLQESVKKLTDLLVKERERSEALKQKRDRKWYKVLLKKMTPGSNSECAVQ